MSKIVKQNGFDVEYSDDMKVLQSCPYNYSGKFVVPNGVEVIGDFALSGRHGITSVKIPDSVVSIGENALSDIPITEIIIPDSVKEIGIMAFMFCSLLERAVLSKSLKTIGASCFEKTDIREIVIPESVECIEDSAFYCCEKLSKVTILNPNVDIQSYAFWDTYIKEIEFPGDISKFVDCFRSSPFFMRIMDERRAEAIKRIKSKRDIVWIDAADNDIRTKIEHNSEQIGIKGDVDINVAWSISNFTSEIYLLDLSQAKFNIEEQGSSVCHGRAYGGNKIDVLSYLIERINPYVLVLPNDCARRHVNAAIRKRIPRIEVSENCKLFSMKDGNLYNKKGTTLVYENDK